MQSSTKKKKLPAPIVLGPKNSMPSVGLGTFGIRDQAVMLQLLRKAFHTGYTLIDTARFYNNEDIIGRALTTCFAEERIKRQDLFLVTKTWNDSKLNFVEELKKSLRSLQLNYVDLYLIHWPVCSLNEQGQFQHKEMEAGWREMEECVRKGYAKNIGVSNFNLQGVMELLTFCKIKPVVNQVECHPYLFNQGLIEQCQRLGVQIMAYCPLARGLGSALQTPLLKEDLVQDLASRHARTSAQIVLRFIQSKGICVIPKTEQPTRLAENIDICFDLSEDDSKKIKTLNKGTRIVDPKTRPIYSYLPLFD